MVNTSEPTVRLLCQFCNRVLQNDASIVIAHVKHCAQTKHPNSFTVINTIALVDAVIVIQ